VFTSNLFPSIQDSNPAMQLIWRQEFKLGANSSAQSKWFRT